MGGIIMEQYFDWICSLISSQDRDAHTYEKVLRYLFNTDFCWVIELDANRADDGIELRYRFGYEKELESPIIASEIDIRPCTILEMMVALSLRCEEDIMQGTEERRVDKWFWVMMENLGLYRLDDWSYDEQTAAIIVDDLLGHRYSPDGKGGLIYLPGIEHDLRHVEIWYQMMWYLTSISKGE